MLLMICEPRFVFNHCKKVCLYALTYAPVNKESKMCDDNIINE